MSRGSLVVIISSEGDAHLEYATRHLRIKHVVIDPEKVTEGVGLSYENKGSRLVVTYNDIVLENVVSVWYRKPQPYEADSLPVTPDYQYYALGALERHWQILQSLFPDALWVSDYFAIARASNKSRQLQIAHELGFKTPDTLFTSSPSAAQKFIKRYKTVIVKTLSHYPGVRDPQQRITAFFASKFTDTSESALAGLHLAPAIFQEAVDAAMDIRVTIVGEKVFAATITGTAVDKPGSPVRDWKIAHHEGSFDVKAYDLPADIADLCIAHVKAQGLRFGAIDLILDKNDQYWFIENNANGQWAFVEDQTNQPIGKAIAELLESPLEFKK